MFREIVIPGIRCRLDFQIKFRKSIMIQRCKIKHWKRDFGQALVNKINHLLNKINEVVDQKCKNK